MTNYFIAVSLGLLGLVLGSFAGATVWRLRARELRQDEKAGVKIGEKAKKQVSKIKQASLGRDRSVCLHCGHTLAWYDLIPLVSWVTLRNKCRYCHSKIGWLEPGVELGLAAFFLISYLCWPVPLETMGAVAQFALWLASGVGLAILLIYDAKWFLLPDPVTYSLLVLGGLSSLLVWAESGFSAEQLFNTLIAAAILSGLYYVIYVFSGHKWIGFGDVKLGLVLALLLADWRLALLALFLANLIGTLVALPLMLGGKVKRQSHIPFGPLLIAGWFLAGLFGQQIITWYFSVALVGS